MGSLCLRRLRQQSEVKTPMRLPSVREYRLMTFKQQQAVLLDLAAIRLAFLQTEEIKPTKGTDEHSGRGRRQPARG